MHEYEIRILRPDGSSALISSEIHLNNHSALRSARKLANGKAVEVWRGMECVYGRDTTRPPTPPPPDHSAA